MEVTHQTVRARSSNFGWSNVFVTHPFFTTPHRLHARKKIHLHQTVALSRMATSNFLGLPLELRDMIYSYIHHEVAFPQCILWYWNRGCGNRVCGDVLFSRVPNLSVLLVSSQVQHEYLRSPSFDAMAVSFQIISVDTFAEEPREDPIISDKVACLMSRACHLTATSLGDCFDILRQGMELWSGITVLAEYLATIHLRVRTVAVILQQRDYCDPIHHSHVDTVLCEWMLLVKDEHNRPGTFAGLQLKQCHLGLLTDFHHCHPSSDLALWGLILPQGHTAVVPGEQHEIFHNISAFGVCTFGDEPSSRTGEDYLLSLLDVCEVYSYPDDLLQVMSEEQKANVARWSRVDSD